MRNEEQYRMNKINIVLLYVGAPLKNVFSEAKPKREISKRSGKAYFKAFGYALKFVTQVLFCTWLSKVMGHGRADLSRRQPHH